MRQALEMALDWIQKQPEETPDSKYDVDTRYVVIREIEAALAQPEQEPVAWLSDDERKAFQRFYETWDDGEGYDVPKPMMKRLAQIGVIHHISRGLYDITKFGHSLLDYATSSHPPVPTAQPKELEQEISVAVLQAITNAGMTLLKTQHGYELRKLGPAIAHGIKE